VSDSGHVVGDSSIADDAERHAFSWTPAGGMIDLGTLGGLATQAYAVNARGQVVGYSSTADNTADHAALWSFGGLF
jgi:probable HAF family extracellular repeat protein